MKSEQFDLFNNAGINISKAAAEKPSPIEAEKKADTLSDRILAFVEGKGIKKTVELSTMDVQDLVKKFAEAKDDATLSAMRKKIIKVLSDNGFLLNGALIRELEGREGSYIEEAGKPKKGGYIAIPKRNDYE